MAWADPTNKIGLAFGTNHLNPVDYFRPDGDKRATALAEALYECGQTAEFHTTTILH